MKLLFDHNLSPRLVNALADLYPNSCHLYLLGLDQVDDKTVWEYGRRENYLIVTKDADFSDLSTLLGVPPKVIWIRRGNCQTSAIEAILRSRFTDVQTLINDPAASILTLF